MLPTGDQHMLKQSNRGALLRQICAASGYSRADLAQRVNLTKSTVSLLVRELIDEGWVVEQEVWATDALGRRPTPLAVNKHKWVLLGLDLAVERICLIATDLTGEILLCRYEEYRDRSNAILSIEQATQLASEVAVELLQVGKDALGLGYALHGIVNEVTGTLYRCTQMGWNDLKVQSIARQVLMNTILSRIPIYVRSEADSCALAQYEFVDHLTTHSLVYISVGHGISSGVVVNHQLLTGHQGFAGDIGHTTMDLNGRDCSCGRKGCAETLIGIRYWMQQTDVNVNDLESDIRLRKTLSDCLTQGHDYIRYASRRAAHSLGTLLQNVWTSLAPQRIVLGGVAIALVPEFLNIARDTLQDYARRASLPAPDVVGSHFGEKSAAVGACALVRHRLTNIDLHSARKDGSQGAVGQRMGDSLLYCAVA
jgi:predicted NBD/HSP70 family sugar kinase/DNA-binding XRE family transcriptional regulator